MQGMVISVLLSLYPPWAIFFPPKFLKLFARVSVNVSSDLGMYLSGQLFGTAVYMTVTGSVACSIGWSMMDRQGRIVETAL
jgi:hypothetical protein